MYKGQWYGTTVCYYFTLFLFALQQKSVSDKNIFIFCINNLNLVVLQNTTILFIFIFIAIYFNKKYISKNYNCYTS